MERQIKGLARHFKPAHAEMASNPWKCLPADSSTACGRMLAGSAARLCRAVGTPPGSCADVPRATPGLPITASAG